jgi:hypothetical protein
VSQPSDRRAAIDAPGALDKSLGEFWVSNPWTIVSSGHNLSAFERDRTWLNVQGKDFLDISYPTGADSDGDGRCVVAADFRNNGRLDLIVRQVGGGPLLLFQNNFPQRHYLTVSLRGRATPSPLPLSPAGEGGKTPSTLPAGERGSSPLPLSPAGEGSKTPSTLPAGERGRGEGVSNRQGIGARLVAEVQGRQVVRELFPLNSLRSQAPSRVHFGLGEAAKVDRLTIRWPSGHVQVLHDIGADGHIVVDEAGEGAAAVARVVPGETIQP